MSLIKPDDLKILLVSLRDKSDPMAVHELNCFKTALKVRHIDCINASSELLTQDLLEKDLILFGGSGAYSVLDDISWIKSTLKFLITVVENNTLAWASCFGFQGLALAMGGKVIRDESKQKLGSYEVMLTNEGISDSVFSVLPKKFYAQFGHHDHVTYMPSGLINLAYCDQGAYQAFKVKGANFWGGQFHPELNNALTWERWEHYREHYEGDDKEQIEKTLKSSPDTPNVDRVFDALIKIAIKNKTH